MEKAYVTADDIPVLLPPEERQIAQASVLFRKVLEAVPVVGPLAAGLLECRAEGRALDRDAEIVRTINALWIVVKGLESSVQQLSTREILQHIAPALQRAGAPTDVTLVLDSYLGLIATMSIEVRQVLPEAIHGELVAAYASVATSAFEASEVINQANRIRTSMNDETVDGRRRIPLEALGNVERDAREFWYRAFDEARKIDSRMVVSLLLARDPAPFSAQGKFEHEKLLAALTNPP